jgi:hypothetical protein
MRFRVASVYRKDFNPPRHESRVVSCFAHAIDQSSRIRIEIKHLLPQACAQRQTQRPRKPTQTLRIPNLKSTGEKGMAPAIFDASCRFTFVAKLRQGYPSARHAAMQLGNHVIDVRRGDVAGNGRVEEHLSCPGFRGRGPRARRRDMADGVTAQLHQ